MSWKQWKSLPSFHSIESPLHRCTDLPRKTIFLGWCGILSWCICSYRNFIAFGLGAVKFTASHFSCEAGNTGNASKVTVSTLKHDLRDSSVFFLTLLYHFLYCQVELCGLMQGSTEAGSKGVSGPLSVTIVSGVGQRSVEPLWTAHYGSLSRPLVSGKVSGMEACISSTRSQQPLTGDGCRIRHSVAETRKFTFLPCIKTSPLQGWNNHSFPLHTSVLSRWRSFGTYLNDFCF